jgi:hypothetical protein
VANIPGKPPKQPIKSSSQFFIFFSSAGFSSDRCGGIQKAGELAWIFVLKKDLKTQPTRCFSMRKVPDFQTDS